MALSTSTSIKGHRVKVFLSPIDPLSIDSDHFFAIVTLAKTTEMLVGEGTTGQNIKKW
jgi:hypothetical protein